MKTYTVYLFYSPDYVRNWLAYLKPHHSYRSTITVKLQAETGSKAKNTAITLANKKFQDLEIVSVNRSNNLWSIRRFPELHYLIEGTHQ